MRCVASLCCLLFVAGLASCSRAGARSYELRGQILAVDESRQEITVKHEDIRGFMPGMTMAFKVKDPSLMTGRTPGELIRATLVVEDSVGYLSSLEVTGRAPLAATPPPRSGDELLNPGEPVPDVQLTDQDGAARRLSDWRGRVLAVTFVYTRCPMPDFCPLMDRQFAAVQRDLGADPRLRESVHLVSVTVDPAFDTPAVLRAHARGVGAKPEIWSFVTGDPDALDRFASRFGMAVMREDPSEVVHNLRTAVIAADGRLAKVFGGNEWTAADLLTELKHAGAER